MSTPTWQFSTLPSRPHHRLATPTDLVPFFGNPEGVENDDTVGFAQLVADLGRQDRERR